LFFDENILERKPFVFLCKEVKEVIESKERGKNTLRSRKERNREEKDKNMSALLFAQEFALAHIPVLIPAVFSHSRSTSPPPEVAAACPP